MKFTNLFSGQNRIFGLDLLRFLAIFFVLLGHSTILVPTDSKIFFRFFVLDGVGIFFVLSGFLVGQILLKQVDREETGFKNLIHFWKRRWMRTLPAYIFVLIALLLYTSYFLPKRIPLTWWQYFTFTQNFNKVQPSFFEESWSLSVEEWFYLLTPTILFIGLIFFKKKSKLLILGVIFSSIFLVILYRWYLFHNQEVLLIKDFQPDILQQVIPRLDGIMIGVLGAYCSLFYKTVWNRLNNVKWFFAMILTLFLLKFLNSSNETFYYGVFYCTIKAIAVLLMLPFLSNWQLGQKANYLTKVVTLISITSYSIYLINRTIVIDIIIKFGMNQNLNSRYVTDKYWIIEYILFWVLSVLLALILYLCIEKPFLKLRDSKLKF